MEHIDLPVKKTGKLDVEGFEMVKWPFFDPHRIIGFLYNKCGLEIPQAAVVEYWTKSRSNREPWALAAKAPPTHVPMGVYGDSATIVMKYGFKESVAAIFVNLCLWRPQSVRMSRFLVCTIPEARLHLHHTMNEILRRVVWSCNALYDNTHPLVGVGGAALAPHLELLAGGGITRAGACFVVTEVRGDWAWLRKLFRFPGWNAHETCFHCAARSVGDHGLRYYNFDDAEWIDNTFTTAQFLSKALPETGICSLVVQLNCLHFPALLFCLFLLTRGLS